MKIRHLAAAAFAATLSSASWGQSHAMGVSVTAIVGATVIHPERDAASAAAQETVVVAGDRIVAVGPPATTPVPKGAKVIDGKGKWLIPGLIDSHVHFFQSGNLYTRPDGADFGAYVPYAKEVAR
ncbi:MAG TPA: hypothetical protein VLJ84_03530, partial [Usitatibacter sp.]|nr:hypothetical protein [Usitatibacter sp.]